MRQNKTNLLQLWPRTHEDNFLIALVFLSAELCWATRFRQIFDIFVFAVYYDFLDVL